MSERDDNRKWLERGVERDPDGWEAMWIDLYGIRGSLDLLDAQSGNHSHRINLTRRPFCNDVALKDAVIAAREATSAMARQAYERWWADTEDRRTTNHVDGGGDR